MIARIAHVGNMTEEEWEKMMKRQQAARLDDLDWLINKCTSCREVGAEGEYAKSI
jgi:hypothetical protein